MQSLQLATLSNGVDFCVCRPQRYERRRRQLQRSYVHCASLETRGHALYAFAGLSRLELAVMTETYSSNARWHSTILRCLSNVLKQLLSRFRLSNEMTACKKADLVLFRACIWRWFQGLFLQSLALSIERDEYCPCWCRIFSALAPAFLSAAASDRIPRLSLSLPY